MVRIRAGENGQFTKPPVRALAEWAGLGTRSGCARGLGQAGIGQGGQAPGHTGTQTPQVPKSQLLWPPDLFQAPMRGWMNRGALVGPGVEPAT